MPLHVDHARHNHRAKHPTNQPRQVGRLHQNVQNRVDVPTTAYPPPPPPHAQRAGQPGATTPARAPETRSQPAPHNSHDARPPATRPHAEKPRLATPQNAKEPPSLPNSAQQGPVPVTTTPGESQRCCAPCAPTQEHAQTTPPLLQFLRSRTPRIFFAYHEPLVFAWPFLHAAASFPLARFRQGHPAFFAGLRCTLGT